MEFPEKAVIHNEEVEVHTQLMEALKRADSGIAVLEICRELGISTAIFHNWHDKYCSMAVPLIGRMKKLEAENARLRKDLRRREDQGRNRFRSTGKKTETIYPREMVRDAVARRGISVRLACEAFGISSMCCRYEQQRKNSRQ